MGQDQVWEGNYNSHGELASGKTWVRSTGYTNSQEDMGRGGIGTRKGDRALGKGLFTGDQRYEGGCQLATQRGKFDDG